jgi:hypothetical protein
MNEPYIPSCRAASRWVLVVAVVLAVGFGLCDSSAGAAPLTEVQLESIFRETVQPLEMRTRDSRGCNASSMGLGLTSLPAQMVSLTSLTELSLTCVRLGIPGQPLPEVAGSIRRDGIHAELL